MIATAPSPGLDWHEIYMEYRDKIRAFIRRRIRINDHFTLDDLTSEVFVRAIDAAQRGHGPNSHLSGWIYQIARNLLTDEYRRRETWLNWDALWDRPTNAPPLDEQVGQSIKVAQVRHAVSLLTSQQAQSLTLRLDGYSVNEIGAIMGQSRKSINAIDTRAFVTLRDYLREVA